MINYIEQFTFDNYVEFENCSCWYFIGDKAIINTLFPNMYPNAEHTILSIEKYTDNDWLVSISPESDNATDYDWKNIDLPIDTILQLISTQNCVDNKLICKTCGHIETAQSEFIGIYPATKSGLLLDTNGNMCGLYACPKCNSVIYTNNATYINMRKQKFKEKMKGNR